MLSLELLGLKEESGVEKPITESDKSFLVDNSTQGLTKMNKLEYEFCCSLLNWEQQAELERCY